MRWSVDFTPETGSDTTSFHGAVRHRPSPLRPGCPPPSTAVVPRLPAVGCLPSPEAPTVVSSLLPPEAAFRIGESNSRSCSLHGFPKKQGLLCSPSSAGCYVAASACYQCFTYQWQVSPWQSVAVAAADPCYGSPSGFGK